MRFPPDRHAKTPQLRAEWERRLRKWFPDAIDISAHDYGFRVVMPHPDDSVRSYKIVYRYNGVSEKHGAQFALVDWFRDIGESLGTMRFVRYAQGSISTLKE